MEKAVKRKKGVLAALAAAMASIFLLSRAVYASDEAIVFTEDPAGAEKGKVYIGAVIEKGFKGEVTVELYPDFEGGSIHKYALSKENGYLASDEIMTGSYDAVAYLSGEGIKNGETATYGGEALKVRPGNEDAPYFAAVAGSGSFVEEYGWLSAYAAGQGAKLCGPVTWQEAGEFFNDAVARQNQNRQEVPGPGEDDAVWEPETDITGSRSYTDTEIKEDVPSEEDGGTEGVAPQGKTGRWKAPAAAAAICILICGAIFIAWRRK